MFEIWSDCDEARTQKFLFRKGVFNNSFSRNLIPDEVESVKLYPLNPFYFTGRFLHPLKISDNQRFPNVFRGYRKRKVPWTRSRD